MVVIIAAFAIVAAVAAAAPLTQSAYAAPQFKAQDDKNNPTFPGCAVAKFPDCQSDAASNHPCGKNPQAAHCY